MIGLLLILTACGPGVVDCTVYHEPDFACDLGDANGTCLEWTLDRGADRNEANCNTGPLATDVDACPHVETGPPGANRGVGGCMGRVTDVGCVVEWVDDDLFTEDYRAECIAQGNTPVALCEGEPCASP